MLIALGAAGVTLAVALGIIGIPAIDACSADPRGVVTCLRDMADRKFDLPGTIPGQTAESAPQVAVGPTGPTVVVDLPPPTASDEPQVTEFEASSTPAQSPVVADVPAGAMPPLLSEPAVEAAQAEPTDAPERPSIAMASAPQDRAVPPLPPALSPAAEPKPVEPVTTEPADAALSWAAVPSEPSAEAPPAPPKVPAEPVTPAEPVVAPSEPEAPPSAEPAYAPAAPAAKPSLPVDPQPVVDIPTVAETRPVPSVPPAQLSTGSIGAIPPVSQPQASVDVANVEPAESRPPATKVIVPLVLAPTIDAIELEGTASYVSGSGPAGALMRLYADGELIGESPVVQGRWLIESGSLLNSPRRELRIEAIEPDTGKLLGASVITIEIQLPDGGTAPEDRQDKPPAFGSSVSPGTEAGPGAKATSQPPDPLTIQPPPARVVTAPEEAAITRPKPPPVSQPQPKVADIRPSPATPREPPPPSQPEPEPVALSEPLPETQPDPIVRPEPLPGLLPNTPSGESSSVAILGPSTLQPTILPPAGAMDHEPSTIRLEPPTAPALVADLQVPEPRPAGQPVTVLRLLPFGEADSARYNVGKAIIRRGDTLWSLARRYYGHGIHYRTIFHANRDLIRRPSRIFPGQVLELPLVTDD